MNADQLISTLSLAPHPEGGHFRRSYSAEDRLEQASLAPRYEGARPAATAIYFLLRAGEVSHLHRLASDELWHFYDGGALDVHVISPDGNHVRHRLGRDLAAGERPQLVVGHGCWFGAEIAGDADYALVGNTVAPGFDFADFELAEADALVAQFPQHTDVIRRLCAR